MISVAEADSLLLSTLPSHATETVGLELSVGRTLAQALVADRDGPPFDRVAMDGFAVDSSENVSSWTIRGLQFAGSPPMERTGTATAVEVATGSMLPRNCDAVIPYEETDRTGDLMRLKQDSKPPVAWRHVHLQGADFRRGDELLPAGTRLLSPHLHSLATVGIDPVTVVRRPLWALAVTGDELVEVTEEPLAWQIRRSNAAAIVGEASAWGLSPRSQAVLPDDEPRLRKGLEGLLSGLDVLVVTGGVSAGVHDLVPKILTDLGAETLFHGVAQRPGRPLWCGRFPDSGTLVFGLPGNPVSSLFTFRRYVVPWLLAAEGRPMAETRVAGPAPAAPGSTVFLPWSDSGPLEWKGSGDFLALAGSTGFIETDQLLPEPKFHPWGGAL